MTPEQLEARAKKRKNERNAGKPCDECAGVLPAHADTCSQYVRPPVNLDDPEQQDRILNPAPATDGKINGEVLPLTVGGEPVELYPLPAKYGRKLVGLVARVIVASARVAMGSTGLRVGIAISDDDTLSAEVCANIARAEHPADQQPDAADVVERALAIENAATFQEYAMLFDRLCSLNHIEKIFDRPKSEAPSPTTT